MPAGEIIVEVLLRVVWELVLYGLSYWTGFLFLKIVTFGNLRLAPLSTLEEKNRQKRKWHQLDWSPWRRRPGHGPALKAEYICLTGLLIWIIVGLGIYFEVRRNGTTADKRIETVSPAE